MKKKIIVEKSDLENLVKSVIKEQDFDNSEEYPFDVETNQQLEMDFPDEADNSVVELLNHRYEEFTNNISNIMSECDMISNPSECEDKLELIHEEIFNIWREMDNLSMSEEHVEKFSELEEAVVDLIETSKQYSSIKALYDESIENLKDVIIKKGI